MPKIYYTATEFPAHSASILRGEHRINVSWEELVWAAISMGKPGVAYLLAHGWHSYADLVVRSHTIYASLKSAGGYFEKSSLYKALDPTEKGATSYFMGMVAAKILGMRLLNAPWLFHLSMFKALGGKAMLAANSEPDLVGLTRRWEWIVAEAKGRTGDFNTKAMENAKKQTQQLRSINGQLPSLRVGVQAFFNSTMEWAIADPEEIDESARDVEGDLSEIFKHYYSAVVSTTESSDARDINGSKYHVKDIPEIGVSVGVGAGIRAYLTRGGYIFDNRAFKLSNSNRPKRIDRFVIFPDGIAIGLDARWSESRMEQDPTERRHG